MEFAPTEASTEPTRHRKAGQAKAQKASRLPGEIIRRTIELFNRDGLSQVSTNLIAAEMGISPGNLHYHFKTRNDLSRAVYEVMDTDLRHALRITDTPETPFQIVQRQIELQRCLWHHRYFFAGFDSMVRKDRMMLERFERLQNWVVAQVLALIENYIMTGVLRPVEPPTSPFQVAQNVWMLWMSWVRWEVVIGSGNPSSPPDEEAVIARLIDYNFSFLAVLMPPEFAHAVASEIAREMPGETAGQCRATATASSRAM